MKLIAKFSFAILFFTTIANFSYAQSRQRVLYSAVATLESKQKIHGKITAINDSALVLVDKKSVMHPLVYNKIKSIKVFKAHKDIGYAIVTGALAAGAIATAQSFDDATTAIVVGVGGTTAVVALSMIMHGVIHGAEVKMKAEKEQINYNTVSAKLSKYIVK